MGFDPELDKKNLKWYLDFIYGKRAVRGGAFPDNLPPEIVSEFITNMLELTHPSSSFTQQTATSRPPRLSEVRYFFFFLFHVCFVC